MTRLVGLLIALCCLGPIAARAQQAPPCGPMAYISTMLMTSFGEVPAMRGPTGGGEGLGVLFINPATQSYTVVIERSDGLACVVLSGKDLEMLSAPKGDDS